MCPRMIQVLGMQQRIKDVFMKCMIDKFIHLFKDIIEH